MLAWRPREPTPSPYGVNPGALLLWHLLGCLRNSRVSTHLAMLGLVWWMCVQLPALRRVYPVAWCRLSCSPPPSGLDDRRCRGIP